jgi:hypothetical protein
MPAPISQWQLDGSKARLALGPTTGSLDLLNPARGIALSFGSERIEILGVDLPAVDSSAAANEVECYVRGNDLVATYHETREWKRRGQIYWRLVNHVGAIAHDAIELVASMQTSLLDSDPTLEIRSHIPADEILQLTDPENKRTVALPLSHETRCATQPSCFVFRLRGSQSSYIEMVHPLDFVETTLLPKRDGLVECTTRFFRGRLEKGVILRSRLRAMIIPQSDDITAAAVCYRDFAATEPPLTV